MTLIIFYNIWISWNTSLTETLNITCVKVFKNGPSKICGRQPLKNSTLSILEYLDPFTLFTLTGFCTQDWDQNIYEIFTLFTVLNAVNRHFSYIQFHWKFWATNSCFWLVNTLLRKFDTSSKKDMKMIKTNFMMKNNKKCQKSRWKHKVVFLFWTRPTVPWYNLPQTLERWRNKKWYNCIRRAHSIGWWLKVAITRIKIN